MSWRLRHPTNGTSSSSGSLATAVFAWKNSPPSGSGTSSEVTARPASPCPTERHRDRCDGAQHPRFRKTASGRHRPNKDGHSGAGSDRWNSNVASPPCFGRGVVTVSDFGGGNDVAFSHRTYCLGAKV